MKKIILSLLASLSLAQSATFVESYSIAGNTTNTVFTNTAVISQLVLVNTNLTLPLTVKFYDSTNAETTYAFTNNVTNIFSRRVQVTEIFTNSVFRFVNDNGDVTNITFTTTNVSWVLKTTNAVRAAATNELQRIATIIVPANTTIYQDIPNIFVGRGLTVANVSGSGSGVVSFNVVYQK